MERKLISASFVFWFGFFLFIFNQNIIIVIFFYNKNNLALQTGSSNLIINKSVTQKRMPAYQ